MARADEVTSSRRSLWCSTRGFRRLRAPALRLENVRKQNASSAARRDALRWRPGTATPVLHLLIEQFA